MATECVRCGQWLSAGDALEGYCWNCKRVLTEEDVDAGLCPAGDHHVDEEDDDGE